MNLSLEAMKRNTIGLSPLCSKPFFRARAIVLSAPQTDFHFQADKSHLEARQLY